MLNYDQWKTTDVEGERAMVEAERASETCAEWVAEEVAAMPPSLSLWLENEVEPGPDDAIVSQYRFWLSEVAKRLDTPENRRLFEGVAHEWQMTDWEENPERAMTRWSR